MEENARDMMDRDQPSERRQIKTIDLPNVKPSSTRIGRLIRTAATEKATSAKPMANIKDLFRSVLSWEMTMENTPAPPDLDMSTVSAVSDVFRSPKEYIDVFRPLIILEAWQQFHQAREELKSDAFSVALIHSITMIDDAHEITITLPSAKVKDAQWTENMVLSLKNASGKTYLSGKAQIVPELRPKSKWNAAMLFSLTTTVREYSSLLSLTSMPLCFDILQTSPSQYTENDQAKILDLRKNLNVNMPQAKAIASAIGQRSGFVLIQGPPGTGKTKTILGLIGAMYRPSNLITVPSSKPNGQQTSDHSQQPQRVVQGSQKRLLCCAPSNAAIDEIARRLMDGILNSKGQIYKPRLVRVGSTAIHSSVKDITLDFLIEKRLLEDETYRKADDKAVAAVTSRADLLREIAKLGEEREALLSIESTIQEGGAVKTDLSVTDRIRDINARRKQIFSQLDDESTNKIDGIAEMDRARRMLRSRILSEADVVLTTLSGAGLDMFGDMTGCDFETVIVDEACQAVELSCLIPLKYGTRKCIMVGDPNQLPPTVLSQCAQQFGYDQSLFQRLMKNKKQTIHLLSIQYRMHPSISAFPSLQFYNSRLKDADGLDNKCAAQWHEHELFPPYSLYDISAGRESAGVAKSFFNLQEAVVCVKIVKSLCAAYPNINFKSRIGIITFYKLQARKLKNMFVDAFGPKVLESVDINTVDGFQGQEKDIILLSCVRASQNGGVGFISDVRRMNVALTRARHSLLILGNRKTLLNNPDWRALVENAETRQMVKVKRGRDSDHASESNGKERQAIGQNQSRDDSGIRPKKPRPENRPPSALVLERPQDIVRRNIDSAKRNRNTQK
eukprot:jgi/Hompol1/4362/HPOL_003596-RA